jgi:hypothetical protein
MMACAFFLFYLVVSDINKFMSHDNIRLWQ